MPEMACYRSTAFVNCSFQALKGPTLICPSLPSLPLFRVVQATEGMVMVLLWRQM